MSRTIPLGKLNLTPLERRKIDRYIDVTKSALLFGGRVVLVEGIAEALLLPVIAKHVVLKGKPDAYRLFRASVFVPIDGVDFEPYIKLLLTPFSGIHIADRVIVITDGDRHPPSRRRARAASSGRSDAPRRSRPHIPHTLTIILARVLGGRKLLRKALLFLEGSN